MKEIEKSSALSVQVADAAADIDLINKYTVRKLAPEEVYCFSVNLRDNDLDRDTETFTDASLEKLATLFLGKTGIKDHWRSAENQFSRIYHTEVVNAGKQNKLKQPLKQLRAKAYMPKTDDTKALIDAIDAGILKEVSVGARAKKCSCSICQKPLKPDWYTFTYHCEDGHVKGETYNGNLCYGKLEDIEEAYEFSLVAVPSQRNAGITKSAKSLDDAFAVLMDADLSEHTDKIEGLLPRLKSAMADRAERVQRAAIIAENKKYLKKTEE